MRPLIYSGVLLLAACGGGGTDTPSGNTATPSAAPVPILVQELQAIDAQRAAGVLSAEQALAAKTVAVDKADKKTAQMTFSTNTFGVTGGYQFGFEPTSSAEPGFGSDSGGMSSGWGYVGIDEEGPYFVPAYEMPKPPPPPPPPDPNKYPTGCDPSPVEGTLCKWFIAIRGYFSIRISWVTSGARG